MVNTGVLTQHPDGMPQIANESIHVALLSIAVSLPTRGVAANSHVHNRLAMHSNAIAAQRWNRPLMGRRPVIWLWSDAWRAGSRASRWNRSRKKRSASKTLRAGAERRRTGARSPQGRAELALAQTQSEMGGGLPAGSSGNAQARLEAIQAQIEDL